MHQKRGDLPQRFLSTPSARRATFVLHNGFVRSCISIHALREEGDWAALSRLPRPLYFYPRPPRGGRPCIGRRDQVANQFLSTPSARRATLADTVSTYGAFEISIHALREEGDLATLSFQMTTFYFYPRPPRGGRPRLLVAIQYLLTFLSTPSARRATRYKGGTLTIKIFLSTPSARRATFRSATWPFLLSNFYPRPPRGGRRLFSGSP